MTAGRYVHDEEIQALVAAGFSNLEIADRLGVHRNTVSNARRRLAIGRCDLAAPVPGPVFLPQPTLEMAWRVRTRPAAGGHLLWVGVRPVLKHGGRSYRAVRVAWLLHHGAEPAGTVRVTCGQPACVRAEHLADMATRQRHHLAVRYVFGRGEVREACRRGHGADRQRVDASGRAYCTECKADLAQRVKGRAA